MRPGFCAEDIKGRNGEMAGIGTETLTGLNTLVFGSLEFLFRYLPVFLLLYCLVPQRFRSFLLFAYSLILYAAGEPKYVLLLLGMTVVNYLFGYGMEQYAVDPDEKGEKRRKLCLAVSVACNVLLLAYFKISNAFDENYLLPVGISFYTFKSLSYLIDVYRLEVDADRSFIRFGAYLCNFSQIVSGPIMRYRDAEKGLKYGRVTAEGIEAGLKKLVLGLCAKVLLADRFGILWNDIQTIGFESVSTPLAWLGMFGYSLQLYFDFAGYSLMAVGIGEMLGFPVIQNFDQPYASKTVSEFYRRWHMTLGSWFRDYVYIPLGGNQKGVLRTMGNLLAVWMLTGLWHGNSLNFVLWGLVLAALIITEKQWTGGFLKRHALIAHVYLLFVIPLTWMIFAIPSFSEMGMYFSRLFPFFGTGIAVNPGDFMKELSVFAPTFGAGILCCVPAVQKLYERFQKNIVTVLILAVLFWYAVYTVANVQGNPFMYANF